MRTCGCSIDRRHGSVGGGVDGKTSGASPDVEWRNWVTPTQHAFLLISYK